MIVNIILIIQFDKIQNLVKIYDYPDSERKLHSRKTPILGGLIILINLLMLLSLRIILSEETYFWNETINTYREIFSFFVTSILLFFVGLYDDNHELLVVGKLGQPVRMSEETDTTFILRWDT